MGLISSESFRTGFHNRKFSTLKQKTLPLLSSVPIDTIVPIDTFKPMPDESFRAVLPIMTFHKLPPAGVTIVQESCRNITEESTNEYVGKESCDHQRVRRHHP